MTTVTASAPGKVVLSGEYAVLDGAPAISMAINRRAVVTLAPAGERGAAVTSVGLGGRNETTLLDCVARALKFTDADKYSITLNTSEFVDDASGVKLGIGSSAALTVALVMALASVMGEETDVGAVAAIAHRDFQNGAGSGVDIATSAAGGLLEFLKGKPGISKFAWPKGLKFALLWSGVAASTRDRVDRLAVNGTMPSRARLSEEATKWARAWAAGDADKLIEDCRNYITALVSFSVDHDLGIFEAGHDDLAKDALADGLAYKPCGAGGGDVGIVLATDSARLSAFVTRAKTAGFKQLDIELDSNGVQLARESD